MKRTVISLITAVAILALFGTLELTVLTKGFSELNSLLEEMLIEADCRTITEERFQSAVDYWEKLRKKAECILSHGDLSEINMRMNECMSFIHNEDYRQAYMQIKVMLFLSEYLPRLLIPGITTIF